MRKWNEFTTKAKAALDARTRLCLAVLVAAVAACPLSAATWPSAGCAGTLQACIDAAAAGDIVEIATDGPIDETPQIDDKSLTLRAAAGFTPVFISPNSIFAFGGAAPATIVVEGLTIANGRFLGVQGGVAPSMSPFATTSSSTPSASARRSRSTAATPNRPTVQ